MNQNLADLQNKIDAVSVSGFNYANFNTLDGKVFSGDTVATTNLLNKLNSNMTGIGSFQVFNVYGTYLNDIVFQMGNGNANGSFSNATPTVSKNADTGAGSSNLASSSNNFTVKEANGNDAKLTNNINLQAVTGGNSASFNTGNGIVEAGNATAVGNVVNLANSNINASQWLWGVVNIFGTMAGNIILPQNSGNTTSNTTVNPSALVANSTTGPLSTNTADYQTTDNTTVDNANSAQITTNIDAGANTGNNTSSANTGGGLVDTGNSNISVSDSTIANTNTVKDDGTVWMVIVNEAGKWVGKIIGAPWGSTSASNALPISQTTSGAGSQSYTVNSTNTGTGLLSDNTSLYSANSDTNITNNNTATIANNVNVTADTGNNTASDNTGTGVIKTGNATAGLNVVNMANTNVVAKKFIAILVNVLGSWLGDVVTPDTAGGGIGGVVDPQIPLPTISPLPTIAPVASNTDPIGYIQPIDNSNTASFTYYEPQNVINYVYVYPQDYTQAVNQVNNAKRWVWSQKQVVVTPLPQQTQVQQQGRLLTRGLFLSPAFAKATESSLPGMLLGGASFQVTGSWLSVIPLAIFIVVIRRRKKFNLEKYLNMLLSIVL